MGRADPAVSFVSRFFDCFRLCEQRYPLLTSSGFWLLLIFDDVVADHFSLGMPPMPSYRGPPRFAACVKQKSVLTKAVL